MNITYTQKLYASIAVVTGATMVISFIWPPGGLMLAVGLLLGSYVTNAINKAPAL